MPPATVRIALEPMTGPDALNGPTRCVCCERILEPGDAWIRSTVLLDGEHSGAAFGYHTPSCTVAIAHAPARRQHRN